MAASIFSDFLDVSDDEDNKEESIYSKPFLEKIHISVLKELCIQENLKKSTSSSEIKNRIPEDNSFINPPKRKKENILSNEKIDLVLSDIECQYKGTKTLVRCLGILESNLQSNMNTEVKKEYHGAAEDLYDMAYTCYMQNKTKEMGESLSIIYKSLEDIVDSQSQKAKTSSKEKLSMMIKDIKDHTVSHMTEAVITQIMQFSSDIDTGPAQNYLNQLFVRIT